METLKENDTVTLFARKWFDKVNGNTYHSVQIFVNGDLAGQNDFEYGYGDQYEQTAKELLEKAYIIPNPEPGIYYSLYRLRSAGINYVSNVTPVSSRKALKF
jgi:hypothetical protein